MDLTDCLSRVHQGDEHAARHLVQAMHPFVMKIIRAYLPLKESEEDLSQKVFIKIFEKLGQYEGRVPFEHWVSRITVNTCLNQICWERRRPELRYSDLSEEQSLVLENLKENSGELAPDRDAGSRELAEKLLACLPPGDRMLIHFLYLEGKKMREIQDLTGWSLPVIKIRAYRARVRMRKCYARLKGSYE